MQIKTLRCLAPALLAALSSTSALWAADSPTVVNPNFSNVAVQCTAGYAYEAFTNANCLAGTTQMLNGVAGERWLFTPQGHGMQGYGAGLTIPGTAFNPPSFSGLPFTQAAFLQSSGSKVGQMIAGFVAGQQYVLSFYLGSRYSSGSVDGNQTVIALIDGVIIGTWRLSSYAPFTLRTASFALATSGTHDLTLVGTTPGDHTAFFSGVSIVAAN